MRIPCLLLLFACLPAGAQSGWWMEEPVRLIQTNLRETDSALDPDRLVGQLAGIRANTLLLNMGGIAAHYPTRIALHYASPHIPPGRDPFGEVLSKAHQRGIRVIGRFDLSKTHKPVYDAHPEWFFRQSSGAPVIYNGLYSTCINGGYYRTLAIGILTEALERYDVDGLFFNMFGNQSSDYSGRPVGLCHCGECERRFRARYGRGVPLEPDADYREFLFASSREVAASIAKLIRAKRPKAGFFTYIQQYTDGIMSESNTSLRRPLPLWPYNSSDNVNRARNSEPGKMAVNLCMSFVDYPWRFATVPPAEIALRLWQNVAHGGALALNMHGTMDQQDRQALDAARPVFAWLAEHERFYAGQRSAARVLLLGAAGGPRASQGGNSYRGLFRVLSERHIPFAVADNLDWMNGRQADFDLVIAAGPVPPGIESFVKAGGRLLAATPDAPPFAVAKPVRRWRDVQGYIRVRPEARFPSLAGTSLLLLNGDFTEVPAAGAPVLTLIPPSMFGPPEKVHIDQRETETPALHSLDHGKGRIAWLPWDLGGLYYRLSLPGHANLLADLIDGLLPAGRQLKTDAHPLVEMSLMRQGKRTLLHLMNLSGHSGTAYFAPLPMRGIRVEITGSFARARAMRAGSDLALTASGQGSAFVVPRLDDYELVVLE